MASWEVVDEKLWAAEWGAEWLGWGGVFVSGVVVRFGVEGYAGVEWSGTVLNCVDPQVLPCRVRLAVISFTGIIFMTLLLHTSMRVAVFIR